MQGLARFLAWISPDIPWHVTAFHRDYNMTGPGDTSAAALLRALPSAAMPACDTFTRETCRDRSGTSRTPDVRTLPVERYGFRVIRNRITPDGGCPECQALVPGFWGGRAERRYGTTGWSITGAGESMAAPHVSPYGGTWYPGGKPELSALLDKLFADSCQRAGAYLTPGALAFVTPHAGLYYSGTVAASAYRRLQITGATRVFILGFSHRGG
jgi:hypothetical protein